MGCVGTFFGWFLELGASICTAQCCKCSFRVAEEMFAVTEQTAPNHLLRGTKPRLPRQVISAFALTILRTKCWCRCTIAGQRKCRQVIRGDKTNIFPTYCQHIFNVQPTYHPQQHNDYGFNIPTEKSIFYKQQNKGLQNCILKAVKLTCSS